jgi:hypothetical protein
VTKPVLRSEIVDYQTYEEGREAARAAIFVEKAPRRVHVGEYLTFLFENHETIRYQIQEMTRVERMVKEADILHEIETYNEVLGGPGALGATLLIEVDSPEERAVRLREWVDLPKASTPSSLTAGKSAQRMTSDRWGTSASPRCST